MARKASRGRRDFESIDNATIRYLIQACQNIHPDNALCLLVCRAAGVQYALGNLEIAKGLLDKAFQTHLNTFRAYKMNMGEKHHKTADIYHKIGWHYHVRKEYQKAM
jgi:hypothetical protein